jgi:hypothetical protein
MKSYYQEKCFLTKSFVNRESHDLPYQESNPQSCNQEPTTSYFDWTKLPFIEENPRGARAPGNYSRVDFPFESYFEPYMTSKVTVDFILDLLGIERDP